MAIIKQSGNAAVKQLFVAKMHSAPAKLIEIKPKNLYLSAAELIKQRHAAVESAGIGLKRTKVESSAAEKAELENAYANLRAQLCVRRIERHTGRAVASWQQDQQLAEVLRKDGKFECFGHNKQGKLYLEYYEALFLLELNRLQLEFGGMIVSVEQAYILLLGEAASQKYNNYLVYSTLTRAGYIVVKHANCKALPSSGIEAVSTEDCIWAILEQTVSNKLPAEHLKNSTNYAAIQQDMLKLKQQIVEPSTKEIIEAEPANDFKFVTRKRRGDSETAEQASCSSKRLRSSSSKSLIDQLKNEPTYLKFQQTFQKFDIVQLQEENYDNEMHNLRNFEITFDLHLHNEGFKRTAPNSPTFSVIILPSNEPFPNHREIIQCQKTQTVPLLVVSVSESKQIQAFLYYTSC